MHLFIQTPSVWENAAIEIRETQPPPLLNDWKISILIEINKSEYNQQNLGKVEYVPITKQSNWSCTNLLSRWYK